MKFLAGGDQYNEKKELVVGNVVTNAMFQFSRAAPILEVALSLVSSLYDPASWTSVGPDLLQRALLTLCGFPPSQPLRDLAMTRQHFRSDLETASVTPPHKLRSDCRELRHNVTQCVQLMHRLGFPKKNRKKLVLGGWYECTQIIPPLELQLDLA